MTLCQVRSVPIPDVPAATPVARDRGHRKDRCRRDTIAMDAVSMLAKAAPVFDKDQIRFIHFV